MPVLITHMFFCHVRRKSIHHHFSADLPHMGLTSTRAATSAWIAARTSVTLTVTVFVCVSTPMRR